MSPSAAAMIERLDAERAIQSVLDAYEHWADRGDGEQLASLYHADGIDEHAAHFVGLGSDFARYVIEVKPQFAAMTHHLTTVLVEVHGDAAAAESYMFGMLSTSAGAFTWAGGRYLDRFERRDGRWRISYRRYVGDLAIPAPTRPRAGLVASGALVGARSHDDPSYALFRRAAGGAAPLTPEQEGDVMSLEERTTRPAAEVLERLEAEAEIRRVLARYCHAVDRGDEELLCSVYHPDGIDEHGSYFVGLGTEFASYVMREKENFVVMMHHLTTTMIDVDGDRAAAQSSVIAMHSMRDGSFFWGAGRYLDRFERRDSEWKIAHRRYVHDLDLPAPTTPGDGPSADANSEGTRSPADPAYELFRAVAAGEPWPARA